MTVGSHLRWLASAPVGRDGDAHFRIGRRGDELVAEWRDEAILVADVSGTRHELTFCPHVSAEEQRKLANGIVAVLLRHLGGQPGFHGSAVHLGERGIALIGASGQGKSTLAAALCRRGATLLADDAVSLAVGPTISILPSDLEHWLDTAASTALHYGPSRTPDTKTPFAPEHAAAGAVPLCGIVTLAWSDGPVTLRRVVGVNALTQLLPHLARFVLDSVEHQRRELEQLERVTAAIPTHILERPRRFETLDATVDVLMDLFLKGRVDEQRGPT